MKYTLGLDVGTNSLGWAIIKLDKDSKASAIEKIGSRIFSDGRNPKDKTTLAAHRRQKRHQRRRYDRILQRKELILNQLVRMQLFPENHTDQQELKKLDVLKIRALSADQKIKKHELGRVIYHLFLRRGFLSNRKGESAEDVKTKISDRINNLKEQLKENNLKTVGQYLNHRYQKGLSTKATVENDFHILRGLIENEFDQIFNEQKKHYKDITAEQIEKLKCLLFYQRPLKPIETGKCSIYPDENRTFNYVPSFEYYRFLAELYNLRYLDENYKTVTLTNDEIFKCFEKFKNDKKVTYTQVRKFLDRKSIQFTIEHTKNEFKISVSNWFFSGSECFGAHWDQFDLSVKDQIAEAYFDAAEKNIAYQNLLKLNIADEKAKSISELKVPPYNESTTPFSCQALQRIVQLIFEEKRHPSGILDNLIKNETLDHSSANKLEYYGKTLPTSTQPIQEHIKRNNKTLNNDEAQFGKIANPTVHAALNQIKIVVNEIIEKYGKPENLNIEFAREMKQSKQEKTDQSRKQKQNEERNNKAKEFILEHKQKITAFNLERVKLWFELSAMKNQNCIYSGKIISAKSVLSDELQIDHILPFSRTLDDGMNNKVLVFASENQKKKNKTPFEAFSKDEKKWAEIQERVAYLPENKKWRFSESAIEQFEKDNSFLSRHLNDTRYISKIAKKYLSSIVDENRVVVSRGQMTALIRGKLGMYKFIENSDGTKNRDDHRHHAIDALAVALTSRSYLKKVSDESASGEKSSRIKVPQPWEGFLDSVEKAFNEIKVSHKVDHDSNGAFMEETCFGVIQNLNSYEIENDFKLVTRKPVENIKANNFDTIRDPKIRDLAFKKGILALPKEIKTLRVYESSKEKNEEIGLDSESSLAKINHGAKKQHQKFYQKGDINHLTIWFLPKKFTLRDDSHKVRKTDYIFKAIKTFDLNSSDINKFKPHPAAKLVVKIFKGDTVALEIQNNIKYFIVKSIKAANKQLDFLEIQKTKVAEGDKQFLLSLSKLSDYNFRKVHISPTGIIKDHGPILK